MEKIIRLIANKIAVWSAGDSSEEEREELVYGYTLVLENLYKLIILLLVAWVTGTWLESVIVLGSFCWLRNYSGGMHSHSSMGCTLCMVGVWLLGILVSKVIIPFPILFIMSGISVWTILKYAPKSTEVNPITNVEIRKNKQRDARIVMAILLLIAFVCGVFLKKTNIMNMILTSMFFEVFSILLLVEKEEKTMKKKEMKKSVVKFGKQIARDSVGKSIPFMFYEPKVPTSLKEQISKECK